MSTAKKAVVKRVRHSMPAFVSEALQQRNLIEKYKARPPYQRNDYLGWIAKAKTEATKHKRLDQMLSELEAGDKYMKMAWSGNSDALYLTEDSEKN